MSASTWFWMTDAAYETECIAEGGLSFLPADWIEHPYGLQHSTVNKKTGFII